MATLIAGWIRISRRRPLRISAIAACLLGAVAVAQAPLRALWRAPVRPRSSVLEIGPPLAPTTDGPTPLANSSTGPTAPLVARPPAMPVDLAAPVTASRVLTSVTQLALAIPEIASTEPTGRSVDDANSRLLREHFARLKAGREQFSRIPGYTATMVKQERVGSSLLDEVTYAIKVRQRPFSVYMKWQSGDDTGNQVLYVDGKYDGQLLVRLGGLKGRIIPALKIDPIGSLALAKSRYPITKLGILALTEILIERRELEIREGIAPHVEQKADAACDGRPCSVYVFEVSDAKRSPVYRKSVQYIDHQWNVPLRVVNYTWPETGQHLEGRALDEATLIEYYMYSEIATDARLSDADFDRTNAEYHFHR